jgi:Ras-related protein Rab-32
VFYFLLQIDLGDQPTDRQEMDRFCDEYGFVGWFETSAKDNINIDESGKFLVEQILKRDPEANEEKKEEGIIDFSKESNNKTEEVKKQEKSCC